MPQIQTVPAKVRSVMGLRWGRDSKALVGLKRIIIEDWCGYLTYHAVCPYSPRRDPKCHQRCTNELIAAGKETGDRGIGYFRAVIRGRRATHLEGILAILERGLPPESGKTQSARTIVDDIMRELDADS